MTNITINSIHVNENLTGTIKKSLNVTFMHVIY